MDYFNTVLWAIQNFKLQYSKIKMHFTNTSYSYERMISRASSYCPENVGITNM